MKIYKKATKACLVGVMLLVKFSFLKVLDLSLLAD